MNCTDLFSEVEPGCRDKVAVWLPTGKQATYGELREIARRTEKLMRDKGLRPGDNVLLFDHLGPSLYGALLGLMGMGVGVALVEPWMPVAKINHVIPSVKPKAFLTNSLGKIWGSRVGAIRGIPHWINTKEIHRTSMAAVNTESVDPQSPAIITFTSGTTGNPKGMVRSHQYLVDQHRILSHSLHSDNQASEPAGADLCIFANFVLSNLASGRSSVVMPPQWRPEYFKAIDLLPNSLQPVSLTCGPAFLLKLMELGKATSLKSVHVGGALTDCWIFEKAFGIWKDTDWTHLYGSTEAEPVATACAKEAVKKSRQAGYFQTLFLGQPIAEIQSQLEPDTVWITGPHVCPKYLANDEENRKCKRQDETGQVWHRMGDRITSNDGWWYSGRENQPKEEFDLEQKVYQTIKSSAAFLHRTESGSIHLYAETQSAFSAPIKSEFPQIEKFISTKIRRDRRHRARIDRKKSLRRPLWNQLVG